VAPIHGDAVGFLNFFKPTQDVSSNETPRFERVFVPRVWEGCGHPPQQNPPGAGNPRNQTLRKAVLANPPEQPYLERRQPTS